jgi:xanthine dehydrogenase iron-sulfur cluster and FAD-binding subunit A
MHSCRQSVGCYPQQISVYLDELHWSDIRHLAINACLAPLITGTVVHRSNIVDGKHVITVEGIGNAKNPHPVQEVATIHG